MDIFKQYRGLRREMYVLFFGRVATSMGSLIWPMLTLILANKLQMNARDIAKLMLLMSFAQIPCTLIGGKLADRFNKRNVIIVCDLVTIVSFFICGFIPVGTAFVVLFFIAGLFAAMEHPCYDALVADLTTSEERERAYSLNYLGMNLGLVLSPIIGGFLFDRHLNLAFIINAACTLASTVLIFLFIGEVSKTRETESAHNVYENAECGQNIWQVLCRRKILLFSILCSGVAAVVYSQFNFLLPLNLEQMYGANGAVYFGLLTSVNGAVVIVGTPALTTLLPKITDVNKMVMGEALIGASLLMYVFIQGAVPLYFVSMVMFTLGEILITLGNKPYLTRRVPASHRGRLSGVSYIARGGFEALSKQGIGFVADRYSMVVSWCVVAAVSATSVLLHLGLRAADKRAYPLLYRPTAAAACPQEQAD